MIVVPLVLIAANITELLHCAEPKVSLYLIGFNLCDPITLSGKNLLFVSLNFAPNLLRGSETLLKSLLDRLLSPTRLIGFGEFTNKPRISLPRVPEF